MICMTSYSSLCLVQWCRNRGGQEGMCPRGPGPPILLWLAHSLDTWYFVHPIWSKLWIQDRNIIMKIGVFFAEASASSHSMWSSCSIWRCLFSVQVPPPPQWWPSYSTVVFHYKRNPYIPGVSLLFFVWEKWNVKPLQVSHSADASWNMATCCGVNTVLGVKRTLATEAGIRKVRGMLPSLMSIICNADGLIFKISLH